MPDDRKLLVFNDNHPNANFLNDLPRRLLEDFAGIDMQFPSDLRYQFALSGLDQAHEHYRSISILTAEGAHGSAAALLRSQYECYVKAIWTLHCATSEEISMLQMDKPLRSRALARNGKQKKKFFKEYIAEIQNALPDIGESIMGHYESLWSSLNSYTHGGALSLLRRVDGSTIQENYTTGDVEEASNLANFYAIEVLDALATMSGNEKAQNVVLDIRIDFTRLNGVGVESLSTRKRTKQ